MHKQLIYVGKASAATTNFAFLTSFRLITRFVSFLSVSFEPNEMYINILSRLSIAFLFGVLLKYRSTRQHENHENNLIYKREINALFGYIL